MAIGISSEWDYDRPLPKREDLKRAILDRWLSLEVTAEHPQRPPTPDRLADEAVTVLLRSIQ